MAAWNPKANEIFLKAVEVQSLDDRRAYLEKACDGEEELRGYVEALIAASEQTGSFLESPHPGLKAALDFSGLHDRPGSVIGPYKLLEQIGEGGMGVVFMADQQAPVRRRVALKIIKPGMDTRQVIARFEAERQALALMDHPNIARVFDAGATESGRPYFVMELVRGVTITDYCDQNNLPVRERLDLYIHVCHAVQHAHQKGIIHRDLKPGNVLVTSNDGRRVPKVIDFGVAKATNQQLTEKTLFTNFSQMVGTPLYMSPEQAEMPSLDIDTRSDVYSLGVLLYELLTGMTPLDGQRLRQVGYEEIRRMIREEEPQKPSTRLSSLGATQTAIAAHRQVDPQRLSRLMRGDLDWIVMKSLEKDRTRRYETANGLARDVQRFLSDQPVEARPPSARYRFRKFARRNRAAMMIGLLFATVIVLGGFVSAWQAIRATRSEHIANAARVDEARQRRIAENERAVAETQRVEADEQRRQAEANLQQARRAVDEYFTLVSESTLLDVPGLQPLRKNLLEAALRFYREFAAVRAKDPVALADLAVTYLRVAEIYHATDRNDDAIAAVDSALSVIDRLHGEFPDDKSHHRRLAGFWKGSRRLQSGTTMPKNPRAAFASLDRLIDTMQTLATENPDEPRFRSDVAALCLRTGDLLSSDDQKLAAVKYFEKSKAVLEELVRDQPNVPEHRADLARVDEYVAASLPFVGREQDAETASRHALSLRQQLVVELPNVPQYRADLVISLVKCAGILGQREPAMAEELLEQACEWSESLVRDFPDNILFRTELERSQLARRILGVTSGTKSFELRPADAQALNDFSWRLVKEQHVDPKAAALAVQAAQQAASYSPNTMFLNTLGVAQYRAGKWADAIASSTRATDLSPDKSDLFNGFFLAMSHWRLGHKDESKAWYDKAAKWMEKNQPKNGDLLRFRAEAEQLMDIPPIDAHSSPQADAAIP